MLPMRACHPPPAAVLGLRPGGHDPWGKAWEQTTVDQRKVVCSRVATEGAETASQDMADTSEWTAVDVRQYQLDERY
ncbi:hypothetical protein [Streptomyces sp. NBC_00887]|uniref:hypothetical protein n=1 Tax=Streptomyces sp. NBC_00887 TaxID=2975859 RepID=UPI00386F9B40|nr:hypothetical protein OG844_01910 [Streptomyces sp. NBC_00887]WSY36892.1 hypothetical protein OG844_43690 [Streptomyces sp. NBC_00887]